MSRTTSLRHSAMYSWKRPHGATEMWWCPPSGGRGDSTTDWNEPETHLPVAVLETHHEKSLSVCLGVQPYRSYRPHRRSHLAMECWSECSARIWSDLHNHASPLPGSAYRRQSLQSSHAVENCAADSHDYSRALTPSFLRTIRKEKTVFDTATFQPHAARNSSHWIQTE